LFSNFGIPTDETTTNDILYSAHVILTRTFSVGEYPKAPHPRPPFFLPLPLSFVVRVVRTPLRQNGDGRTFLSDRFRADSLYRTHSFYSVGLKQFHCCNHRATPCCDDDDDAIE